MAGMQMECGRPDTWQSVLKALVGLPMGIQRAPVAVVAAMAQWAREWMAVLANTYTGWTMMVKAV